MEQLMAQRKALAVEASYAYTTAFPGSKKYNAMVAADGALAAFDREHPEVVAEVKAQAAAKQAERVASINPWTL